MSNKQNLPFLSRGGATLSDRDIKLALEAQYIEIKSPFPLNIQPSSIDLHLAPTILIFPRVRKGEAIIDLREPADHFVEYVEIPKSGFVLHPREFLLGATSEWLKLPKQLCASVDGKSSLGRLGLVIHSTAGFIDPGFIGHVTLEITNLTEQPLRIYPNIPIGQIRFSVLTSEAENAYGSAVLGSKKYKNSYSLNPKPIASQYWKNLK